MMKKFGNFMLSIPGMRDETRISKGLQTFLRFWCFFPVILAPALLLVFSRFTKWPMGIFVFVLLESLWVFIRNRIDFSEVTLGKIRQQLLICALVLPFTLLGDLVSHIRHTDIFPGLTILLLLYALTMVPYQICSEDLFRKDPSRQK